MNEVRIKHPTGIEIREIPVVDPKSAREQWVTKNFRRLTVGEMGEAHAKHTLALILRNLRAGNRPVFDEQGRLCWRRPLADLSEWTVELEAELMRDIDPLGQDMTFPAFATSGWERRG